MFHWNKRSRSDARLPSGQRVYAIGDLHGEALLFKELLAKIRADNDERGPAYTVLVLLGDIIDRGKDAADLLLTLSRLQNEQLIILRGNHEAALVDCYRGDEEALGFWLRFGGRATMIGFGVTEVDLDTKDSATLLAMLQSRVDPQLISWIERLPTSWSLGDYFFTHAGIRPGVRLDAQDKDDLMWIREPFLSSSRNHGKVVVHGHTVESGIPQLGGNRIGIDTGGHELGCLTALGLEGHEQWVLQATSEAIGKRGPALDDEMSARPSLSTLTK